MYKSTLLLIVGLAVLLLPQAGMAASKEKIKAMLEQAFGVEVLRLRETEVDGRPALAATVMNRAGNSNAAFQVNTLIVDAETGALLPQFRHLSSGYTLGGSMVRDNTEDSGERGRRMLTQTR